MLGSLLTLGGVWAPAAVPPGRGAGWPAALLVLLVALAGARLLAARLPVRPLLLAAGLGLLVAVAGRVPGLADLLRAVVVHVPGGGLLRDQQKWVAPLGVLVAAAAGCGVEALQPRLRVAGVVAVLAPLAALPTGLGLSTSALPGRLAARRRRGRRRPAGGARRRAAVDALPGVPVDRRPDGARPAAAPGGAARAVVDDDLPLAAGSVRGEDRLADVVDAGVAAGGPLLPALREAGAGLVVVERTTRDADPAVLAAQTAGLTPVLRTAELELYAVPGGGGPADRLPLLPVVLGHAASRGTGSQCRGRGGAGRRAATTQEQGCYWPCS